MTPNTAFLGEINQKYSFEKRPENLTDDSALTVKTKNGLVVITGCSHSGICNIIAQAKKVFKGEKVYSVIGGFHLRGENKEKLKKTAEILKKEVTDTVYPAHCVDFDAKCFLASKLKTEQVFVSKIIEFE